VRREVREWFSSRPVQVGSGEVRSERVGEENEGRKMKDLREWIGGFKDGRERMREGE
jgi:hypothetical protein